MSDFHTHEEFEIYFCMQNDVKFLLPDKVYNLTYGDIVKRRIAKACYLFRNECTSVKKVAEMVGFKDTSYFIKIFNQLVGTTPGNYVKCIVIDI